MEVPSNVPYPPGILRTDIVARRRHFRQSTGNPFLHIYWSTALEKTLSGNRCGFHLQRPTANRRTVSPVVELGRRDGGCPAVVAGGKHDRNAGSVERIVSSKTPLALQALLPNTRVVTITSGISSMVEGRRPDRVLHWNNCHLFRQHRCRSRKHHPGQSLPATWRQSNADGVLRNAVDTSTVPVTCEP